MPQWLRQQLMKAYFKKDCRQIRLLNECWFFYRNTADPEEMIQKNV
ncbi:cortex morphogenetic protein CmpA [Paenibacillus sp. FSL K6-1217]